MTTHETSIPIHGVTAVHNLKIRAFDNIFMLSDTSSCHRVPGCLPPGKAQLRTQSFKIRSGDKRKYFYEALSHNLCVKIIGLLTYDENASLTYYLVKNLNESDRCVVTGFRNCSKTDRQVNG